MTRILALDLSLARAAVCRLLETRAGQPVFATETAPLGYTRLDACPQCHLVRVR